MMTSTAMTYEVPTMNGRGLGMGETRLFPSAAVRLAPDAAPVAKTETGLRMASALSRIDMHQGQQIAGAVGIAFVLAMVARKSQRRWVASLATTSEQPRLALSAAEEAMEREAFIAKYATGSRYAVGSGYATGSRA